MQPPCWASLVDFSPLWLVDWLEQDDQCVLQAREISSVNSSLIKAARRRRLAAFVAVCPDALMQTFPVFFQEASIKTQRSLLLVWRRWDELFTVHRNYCRCIYLCLSIYFKTKEEQKLVGFPFLHMFELRRTWTQSQCNHLFLFPAMLHWQLHNRSSLALLLMNTRLFFFN